jgi:hypothetical protein
MNARTQFPFGNGQTQLELSHPHIVERLRLLWGHPEGLTFLSGLLVDNRGGRKGFTREVFNELAALLDRYPLEFTAVRITPPSGLAWRTPGAVFADSHDLSRRRVSA